MAVPQISPGPEFEDLLAYIKASRAFDYTGYKRASLMRRFARRMQELRIDGFGAYRDYLEGNGDEFGCTGRSAGRWRAGWPR